MPTCADTRPQAATATATPSSEVAHSNPPDLAREWHTAFGTPLPAGMVRGVAERCLLYRRQERRHGGLSAAALRILADLAPEEGVTPRRRARATPRFKPGTRLLRTWRGRTYVVTIATTGYQYDNRPYRSLSVIAREITGTPWSGPAFFGLNKAPKAVRP